MADLPTLDDVLLAGTRMTNWKCGARQSNRGSDTPADCNWPVCGCDPYAGKVIEALQESGLLGAKNMTPGHYVVCSMIWLATADLSAKPIPHVVAAIAFGALAIVLQRLGSKTAE